MPGHKYHVNSLEYVSGNSRVFLCKYLKFISKYLEKCSKHQQMSLFPFSKSRNNDSISVKVFFIGDYYFFSQ